MEFSYESKQHNFTRFCIYGWSSKLEQDLHAKLFAHVEFISLHGIYGKIHCKL